MAGRLPRVTGATGSVDTAGEGGLFVPHFFVQAAVLNAVIQTVANRVSVCQFVLPFRIKVVNIVVNITTPHAANFCAYAIYTPDGNTVLLESGAISTASAAVVNTAITAVTLEPGPYFAAWTATQTTAQAAHETTSAVVGFTNENNVRIGRAANASSSSVFPATLGTITAAAIHSMAAYLEP